VNIVVPYTRVHPDTWAALWDLDPRYADTSGDVEAYWRLLCELWKAGETFIIVEHDIVPGPGTLQAMWDCEQPWCAYPYPVGTPWETPCLGCSKFDARLMEWFPNLMEKVGSTYLGYYDGERIEGRHWFRMDMAISLWLSRWLGKRRIMQPEMAAFGMTAVHKHPEGMVEHRHDYQRRAVGVMT